MSTRRPTLVAALAAAGLILSAGPVQAIPVEGTPDPTRCERLLSRAAEWPGRLSDNTRLVSDGYVSYLASRPECVDPRS